MQGQFALPFLFDPNFTRYIDVDIAIRGAANKVMTIRKILEERLAGSGENPEAFHAAIVERSNLILRVQQLLQDGGFGDSSEEDVDEVAAPEGESSNRRKMDNAAKSQPSDARPAPPALQARAFQARAYMAEKGFDDFAREGTTVIVECCTDSSERRLH